VSAEARREAVRRFYDRLLATRSGPAALGWSSVESQRVRFLALSSIGDLGGRSVLDVGCGPGDLCGYFRERGIDVDYTGVDIHPGMIERARRAWPGARFVERDILDGPARPEADYVLASGLFGLAVNGEPDFVLAMLRRMYDLSRRGAAANFVSVYPARERDPEGHYADPAEVVASCFRITSLVAMRHDYKANDFTVYLRRPMPEDPA